MNSQDAIDEVLVDAIAGNSGTDMCWESAVTFWPLDTFVKTVSESYAALVESTVSHQCQCCEHYIES